MGEFGALPEGSLDVVLDLETMGTESFSPIIAIGAVRFEIDQKVTYEPFYQAVTLESAMKAGLRPSAATIQWWMKQNPKAQEVFDDPAAVALPQALDAFTDWYASRPDFVWGNSAAFDIGLLRNAYQACGKECPIAFYREKCYRTLKGLPGMDRFKLQRSGTYHNALDDAISQARHCVQMLKYLDGKAQYERSRADAMQIAAGSNTQVVDFPDARPLAGVGTDPLQR